MSLLIRQCYAFTWKQKSENLFLPICLVLFKYGLALDLSSATYSKVIPSGRCPQKTSQIELAGTIAWESSSSSVSKTFQHLSSNEPPYSFYIDVLCIKSMRTTLYRSPKLDLIAYLTRAIVSQLVNAHTRWLWMLYFWGSCLRNGHANRARLLSSLASRGSPRCLWRFLLPLSSADSSSWPLCRCVERWVMIPCLQDATSWLWLSWLTARVICIGEELQGHCVSTVFIVWCIADTCYPSQMTKLHIPPPQKTQKRALDRT